jgi:hypothetical protein
MKRSGSVLAAALALVALAGCGADSPSSPAPAPTSPATTAPSAAPSGDASPTAGVITVTGQIAEGVETGCKVLRAPGREYLLVVEGAADFALPVGETVTVTGRVQPDLITTCQQGIPLVVSSVRPA